MLRRMARWSSAVLWAAVAVMAVQVYRGEYVSLCLTGLIFLMALVAWSRIRDWEKAEFWLPSEPLNKNVSEFLGELAQNELLGSRANALIFAIKRAFLIDYCWKRGGRVVAKNSRFGSEEVLFNNVNPEIDELNDLLPSGTISEAESEDDSEEAGC